MSPESSLIRWPPIGQISLTMLCIQNVSTRPDFAHFEQVSTSIYCQKAKVLWEWVVEIVFNEPCEKLVTFTVTQADSRSR